MSRKIIDALAARFSDEEREQIWADHKSGLFADEIVAKLRHGQPFDVTQVIVFHKLLGADQD